MIIYEGSKATEGFEYCLKFPEWQEELLSSVMCYSGSEFVPRVENVLYLKNVVSSGIEYI